MSERTISCLQFSRKCSYMARSAADWAADIMLFEEDAANAANPNDVARFTDEMRRRLDDLDKLAGHASLGAREA